MTLLRRVSAGYLKLNRSQHEAIWVFWQTQFFGHHLVQQNFPDCVSDQAPGDSVNNLTSQCVMDYSLVWPALIFAIIALRQTGTTCRFFTFAAWQHHAVLLCMPSECQPGSGITLSGASWHHAMYNQSVYSFKGVLNKVWCVALWLAHCPICCQKWSHKPCNMPYGNIFGSKGQVRGMHSRHVSLSLRSFVISDKMSCPKIS